MKLVTGLFGVALVFTTFTAGFGLVFLILVPVIGGSPPYPGAIRGLAIWTPAALLCWLIYTMLKRSSRLAETETLPAAATSSSQEPGKSIDASSLPADWSKELSDHGFDLNDLKALVPATFDSRVHPRRTAVFRAFHLTRFNDVRVVILGQDPYPDPGKADGLAFSVPNGEKIPRSLSAMFTSLSTDQAVRVSRPQQGDLAPWANQGVLLLNAALTVETDRPGSHLKRWRRFTKKVLRALNAQRTPLVFILLGDYAVELGSAAELGTPHKVIELAHPAAWAKTTLPKVGQSDAFSEANAFLAGNDRGQVNWVP